LTLRGAPTGEATAIRARFGRMLHGILCFAAGCAVAVGAMSDRACRGLTDPPACPHHVTFW
jgi:hypothetical protein